ncbi:hypothetical protein [Microbulbifer agarilyticus]
MPISKMRWVLGSLAALILAFPAHADGQEEKRLVSPVVVTGDSGAAVLGLTYEFKRKSSRDFSNPAADGGDDWEEIDTDKLEWGYTLKGTITGDPENNPENFMEFDLFLNYVKLADLQSISDCQSITCDPWQHQFGGVYKYEADQSLDDKQTVLGLRYLSHYGFRVPGTYKTSSDLYLSVAFGEVTPIADGERQKILGDALEPFNRWDLQALYKVRMDQLLGDYAEDLELSYRYFSEVDAPEVIEQAELDRFGHAKAVLNLKNNMFIAYTDGELPLDRAADSTFKLGWNWDLAALGL